MTHSYAYINKSTALGKARELLTTSGGAPKPEPELWVHVASATSRDQLYPCGSWRNSVQIHISLASFVVFSSGQPIFVAMLLMSLALMLNALICIKFRMHTYDNAHECIIVIMH